MLAPVLSAALMLAPVLSAELAVAPAAAVSAHALATGSRPEEPPAHF